MLKRSVALLASAAFCVALTGIAYAGAGKPPKNPSSLTATAVSPTQINLTWVDNARDEDGFLIQRKIGAEGTFEDLDTVGPNIESYADTTCSPSTTYCYRVCAFNQYGYSSWSPTACDTTPSGEVPPADPSDLVATAVSTSQIDLSWVDNSGNEDGFKIEVDEGNTGTFVYLDTVGPDITSYPDTGLTEGVEYCYRVYAYNAYGDSGYSNVDCATPSGVPPAAPSNLSATAVSSTQIELGWIDNSGNEDGFVVEVDEGNTGTFSYLDTVGPDVTEYPHGGLSEGTVYCYRVYAYNTYGDSGYSNVDCAVPGGGQVVTVSTVEELRAAVDAATPGTIIELTDGLYAWDDNTTLAHVNDKTNLTIRSQSGNRDAVILQGLGINNRNTQFVFKLYRSNHITIQDMTLRDVYWHCVQVNEGSSYCTLRNLYMWDAGEGPVKSTVLGTTGPFSDYGLVEDCVIGYTDTGERSVVEGIDLIASAGWVVSNCDFIRVRKGGPASKIGYGFFAKAASEDTVVENCYLEDCDIPLSLGGGGSPLDLHRNGAPCEHYRGIMRNNIVNRTKDVGVYMNNAAEFKLYNNTIWSTYSGGSSVDVRFEGSSGWIYNNICSQGYQLRDGGQATFANNIWYASPSLFVDQPNGDFHLVSTATDAIDQGVDTTADVPYDMDWEARPKGSAVDIGADEY